MAADAIAKFVADLQQNDALRAEAERAFASASDRFAALAEFAARHGYEVTAEEVKAAVEAASAGALSDADLEKVSGGAYGAVQFLGGSTQLYGLGSVMKPDSERRF